MSSAGKGGARHKARPLRTRERLVVDGLDIGVPMMPNEVFVVLKRIVDLADGEILAAFEDGIDHFASLPPDAAIGEWLGLPEDEREAAINAAASVTRSKLRAWRTHSREMTWGELRVLLRGL